MGAMPGMESSDEKPKGKGVDLAIIMGGKPKGDSESMAKPKEPSGDELPPGFEEAAVEAFPDLDGDPERVKALLRAIKACDSDDY